jgi:hypothetical protein
VTTSSNTTFAVPFVVPGTKVWVMGRWFNSRGPGPLSVAVYEHLGSMIIDKAA